MNPFELRVPSFELARFGRTPDRAEVERVLANRFFEGVEAPLAARAAGAFRLADLPSHMVLFERWDASSIVFLLIRGRVGLERVAASGERLDLGRVEAGGFFGEDALFAGIARVHRMAARCREPSTVAFASAQDLVALVDAGPAVGLNVARALHDRLAALVEVITQNAPLRTERGVS